MHNNNYLFQVFQKFIYSQIYHKVMKFIHNPSRFNTSIKIIELKQIRFIYYIIPFISLINFIISFKRKKYIVFVLSI